MSKAKREREHRWNPELGRGRIDQEHVMTFARQCASFVSAGVTVIDALEVIGRDTDDPRFRKVVVDLHHRVRDGAPLSDAAEAHPEAFRRFAVEMLRSAEMTGRLDEVLDRLAGYLERDLEVRRRIRSALTYPSVVAVMAVVTVIILTGYVLPRFEVFFSQLGARLPLVTRVLLAGTRFFGANLVWIVGGLLSAVLLAVGIGRTARGRMARDSALLRLPAVGRIVRLAIVERFCRVMASLVAAGVALPEAMEVAGSGSGNVRFRRGLDEVRTAMIQGGGMAEPLARTGVLTPAAEQLVRVGEETGSLPEQLVWAARLHERELDHRLARFTDLFEPAVIIVVGSVVGFVAIALVSAMYGIYGQVQA